MRLSDLTGEHLLQTSPNNDVRHPFDPDAGGIAWEMDDKTFFVFEDPNDGYRSHAAPILVADGSVSLFGGGWYPDYINRPVVGSYVERIDGEECELIEFRDKETGHLWMRVGTRNTDDYYPWFVAEWNPMPA